MAKPQKTLPKKQQQGETEALRKKLSQALSDDALDDGIPYEYLKLDKNEQMKVLNDVIESREKAHFNARLQVISIEGNESARGEEKHYEGEGKPLKPPRGKDGEEPETRYVPCQCFDCQLMRSKKAVASYEFQLRQYRGLLREILA